MQLGSTLILDTFAEAFRMRYARVLVTAADEFWLDAALREFCGYASSVIACDAEIGIERFLTSDETPDGRPGAAVLAFGFAAAPLGNALLTRVGQCLLPCATTAAFNGLSDAEEYVPLGRALRFFGDGFQKSKLLDGRRYWRIPVMDGEFLVVDSLFVGKGVAGGNFILQAAEPAAALAGARRASAAIAAAPGVIAPFPGGVARSGSKVGSRYKKLKASTSDAYCPTLRGRVESKLDPRANCAYEVVIDGSDEAHVARAMAAGIRAACGSGVIAITAGNYGGKLGKFHFHLRQIM